MFGRIGAPEILIIMIIIFFLFGGKKLKELARGLGESSREMKKVKKEYEDALKDEPFPKSTKK